MENALQKPKTSPKDFFLNLGSIILLYSGVISLLNLIFSIINDIFPDAADFYTVDYQNSSIRWAIACLLVIYPLYLYIMKIMRRDIVNFPEKRELGVRKWLTYLTLFIAGTTISIDLIVSLNAFLGGELTIRFLSKVLSVFIVLVIVFKYYLLDLRGNNSYDKKIFLSSLLLVSLSIIGGFYIMGSPATQRMMRFDEKRVQDLQSIQWQVVNYWQQKEKIPQGLKELNDSISGFIVPSDPETNVSYTYETMSTTTFKICAEFNLDDNKNINSTYPKTGGQNDNWTHKKGDFCFDRNIDTDLYPPRTKMPAPIPVPALTN